jgi:hypothetical protein
MRYSENIAEIAVIARHRRDRKGAKPLPRINADCRGLKIAEVYAKLG